MRFDKLSYQSTRRSAVGFTLVEMLVVIVIIAIVAAIIFPVSKKVIERSRQSNSISNLSQIGQALARYQQDHEGHSPPVLFGYAGAAGTMQSGPNLAKSASTYLQNFPGLYPSYIKDASVFVDPNNQAKPTDTTNVDVNVLCPSSQDPGDCNTVADGTLVASSTQAPFYSLDSYDLSPEVTATQSTNPGQLVPRYQTSWTNLDTTYQLRVPRPNGNTYVTMSTYHVDQTGNLLILFQDGSVHTVSSSQLLKLGGGSDVASIAATSGASASNVWKLEPGGGTQN